MNLTEYISSINSHFKTGISTEHTYRGDLQSFLQSLLPDVIVTNEPSRGSWGAPDYILTRNSIPLCHIEAKDLGADLKNKQYNEQFNRYKAAASNLIITNYLDFEFYKQGELVTSLSIGEIEGKKVRVLTENEETFINLITDFATNIGQSIKSPKKLAEMMAVKAKILAATIEKALDESSHPHELQLEDAANITLNDQLKAFQDILIHDLSIDQFADIYSQTIAYGMFAARLHDPSLNTFTRQEAAELIPKSNPFLRKLFQYIAGYDLDPRIKWIVDALADIFRATDIAALLKNFGQFTGTDDPIIHFYETFLSEYDPKLRKSRGVYYTPEPVVKFIVRAVDDILKTEFDLPDGLADTSKTKIKVKVQTHDNRHKAGLKEIEQEVHKVQILDPATGTATFLAEVVKFIYHKKFEGQKGIWSNYVENHLLPRLNGFEILMASYAMAHLKLDLLLTETGYTSKKNQRLRIYLTNTLEEYHPDTGKLFANWLSAEANEANMIKRDTPVMCIIGNPPYSGESSNKGEWIMKLMDDYKKEPEGKEKLKEQNSKFINDDYVKFLRYGQFYIEKNGSGILAFINPHGFLDNPTFRGMRWNLLKTYDSIYTIDLHGNAKKKEISPDGSADENVFDIEQGVSINLLIKTGKKKQNDLGKVFHYDLFGNREFKYDFLDQNTIRSVEYKELKNSQPNYFFTSKDFSEAKNYNKGFSVTELFLVYSLGLLTKRDELSVDFNQNDLQTKINFFLDKTIPIEDACKKFNLVIKDNDKWDAIVTRKNVAEAEIKDNIRKIQYRPFDNRFVFYNSYFVARPNTKVMNHFIKDNAGLIICRQGQAVGGEEWNVVFTCKYLTDQNIYRRGGGTVFPLYLYEEENKQQSITNIEERKPNFNPQIVKQFSGNLGMKFSNEKENSFESFSPIDILNYIYAVLHSAKYREKFKEFLKIDFPRIPYPEEKKTFWKLVKLGEEIRLFHLLENDIVNNFITMYPIDGDNIVDKIKYVGNKVFINETQYFANVPSKAWAFYVGGYQPAQKWLKDRKDRKLEFEDIQHYQKIIVALSETDRIMNEIDQINFIN